MGTVNRSFTEGMGIVVDRRLTNVFSRRTNMFLVMDSDGVYVSLLPVYYVSKDRDFDLIQPKMYDDVGASARDKNNVLLFDAPPPFSKQTRVESLYCYAKIDSPLVVNVKRLSEDVCQITDYGKSLSNRNMRKIFDHSLVQLERELPFGGKYDSVGSVDNGYELD